MEGREGVAWLGAVLLQGAGCDLQPRAKSKPGRRARGCSLKPCGAALTGKNKNRAGEYSCPVGVWWPA